MEKKKYVPLHERLQIDVAAVQELKNKQDELDDLFRGVFETENGQRLLGFWVDKYIGTVPSQNSTPTEIMFHHGMSMPVREILTHLRQEK